MRIRAYKFIIRRIWESIGCIISNSRGGTCDDKYSGHSPVLILYTRMQLTDVFFSPARKSIPTNFS